MKKLVLLFLSCILLLVSFSGCSLKDEESVPQLLVGYGRASIVPDFPAQLAGGYPGEESRYFNNVLDPIYATAIAFTDQDNNTVILIQYDLGKLTNIGISRGIKEISEKYGIPNENILAAATHTHSAPKPDGVADDAKGTKAWKELLQRQTVAAATEAMESRMPAEIYAASIDTVNLNFIRHYYMDDGSIVGDNFGNPSGKKYVRHTQKVDPELQLLRFKRQGGKDIVLANFQAHPLRTGGAQKLDLSSDFIGPMTVYVEENLDCHFAYFSGASGNVDPTSRINSENITQSHTEQGVALGKYAALALSSAEKLESGAVRFIETACSVSSAASASMKTDIKLRAFSIGDVAFVNVPYEMFCSNGKYVKDNSPFKMTFVTTIALGIGSYIPDAATFAYDVTSYEESSCAFVEGTGELLAEGFVDILDKLYAGSPAE